MEGAAVAQVSIQEGIDWLIVRVISDSANDEADQNFEKFLSEYNNISSEITSLLINEIGNLV